MEQATSPTDFILATRSAIAQAGALLVQYSFSIVGALVLLAVGWFVARLVHRWAIAGMNRIHGFDITLSHFLANVIRYAILILVAITVLGQFGVQTASIIAALGAAGLAIGLALQGTLQNIAAGIMLLVLRPFRVGETIETNNVAGTVQEIGLFATELKTGDGLYLLAPNSTLWNTPVKNYSRLPTRRFDVSAILPLAADVKAAEQVMTNIAERDRRVRRDPAPAVAISDITKDTMKLTLSVWLNNQDYGAGARDLQKGVKRAFDRLRETGTEEASYVAGAPDTAPPEKIEDQEPPRAMARH